MITERNIITRTTQIYPQKTLKGKTQQKLPQYRCPKKIKGKTNRLILLLLQLQLCLSLSLSLSLSLMRYTSECECVPNEERLTSIYILSFT